VEILGQISRLFQPPIMLALFAFLVTIVLLSLSYHSARNRQRRQRLIRKIRELETTPEPVPDAPPEKRDSRENPFFTFLKALGSKAASDKSVDASASRIMFARAGLYGEHVLASFWGAKTLLGIGAPLLFLLARLLLFKMMSPMATLYIGLALAFAGFYLPNLWVQNRFSKRRTTIFKGLPDAIDLLVICVEAGMGLNAAIGHVAQELKLAHPELSKELTLVTLEMRAGKSRKEALKSLAVRTGLDDVESLVTVLNQTEQFGTSVSRSLRVFSDSFRSKRFQKAEEIAGKLSVKLTIPCILFIFPALFVVLAAPAMIRVFEIFLNR